MMLLVIMKNHCVLDTSIYEYDQYEKPINEESECDEQYKVNMAILGTWLIVQLQEKKNLECDAKSKGTPTMLRD